MKKKIKATLAFLLILSMAIAMTGNAFAVSADNDAAAYQQQTTDKGTQKASIVSIFFTVGSSVYCQSEVPAGFEIQNAYGVMLWTFQGVQPVTDVRGFLPPGTYQVELLLYTGGFWLHTGNKQPLIIT